MFLQLIRIEFQLYPQSKNDHQKQTLKPQKKPQKVMNDHLNISEMMDFVIPVFNNHLYILIKTRWDKYNLSQSIVFTQLKFVIKKWIKILLI